MSILKSAASIASAPGTAVSTGVEASMEAATDQEADDYLSRIEEENSDYRKKALQSLSPPPREGTAAHMSIWRYLSEEVDGELTVVPQPVRVRGRTLKEYRFIITRTQMPQRERMNIMQTFGEDPDVAMSFGEQPKVWQFQGLLPSQEGQNDWMRAMNLFYRERLRASIMMRNQEFLQLRVGDFIMRGYLMRFNVTQSQENDDAIASFSMAMYVRSYRLAGGAYYEPASEALRGGAAGRPPSSQEGDAREEIPGATRSERGMIA